MSQQTVIEKNYTLDIVNTDGLSYLQLELIRKLNISRSYDVQCPKDSIMSYGQLCHHDSGYLCECRLQYIIEQLKK